MKYQITPTNVHIEDSYKITNKQAMMQILKAIRSDAYSKGYDYKRSDESWISEWLAHNVLYKCHIARKRTKDVDLNEGESGIRLLLYWFISIFS